MDTPAEFRKYAANCKKMSNVSEDPEVRLFGTAWKNDGFCVPN